MRKGKSVKREVRRPERQKAAKRKRGIWLGIGLLFLLGRKVQAAELQTGENAEASSAVVDTITKTVRLPAGQVTQISRYEEAGEILYVLDESSIRVRAVGTEKGEGADVCTFTKTIADLPDNDLERIPMTMSYQGNSCELLYVIYTVSEWDAYELPEKYEAVCCYGWLEKYWISYDADWEASMTYLGYPVVGNLRSTLIQSLHDYEEIEENVRIIQKDDQSLGEGDREFLKEMGNLPITRIQEEKTPLASLRNFKLPTVIAVFVTALLSIFLPLFFCFLTAPVYAVQRNGDFWKIGRIWMKRVEGHYEAILTEALLKKTESKNFMIRISKYLNICSPTKMLDIRCPSGEVIRRKLEREVLFRISEKG